MEVLSLHSIEPRLSVLDVCFAVLEKIPIFSVKLRNKIWNRKHGFEANICIHSATQKCLPIILLSMPFVNAICHC